MLLPSELCPLLCDHAVVIVQQPMGHSLGCITSALFSIWAAAYTRPILGVTCRECHQGLLCQDYCIKSHSALSAVVLKAVWPDPLTQAGGLLHVSEMGRLCTVNQHMAAHEAASDDEEGQHALHGDSDDGDFAQEQALLTDDDLSDTDSDGGGHQGLLLGHGMLMGQQLAIHPMAHFAGVLHPHDHDGDFPLEPEEYPVSHD